MQDSQSAESSDPIELMQKISRYQLRQAESQSRQQKEGIRAVVRSAQEELHKTLDRVTRVLELMQHFRDAGITFKENEIQPGATVHNCVHQVLHAMEYEFPFRGVTVLKILPHDLPPLRINREQFEAILFQLVYSARQALSDKVGVITIEAQEKVRISPENSDLYRLVVRVSDSAMGGMTMEELAELFEPFSVSSTQQNQRGGFGLYLAKKLAEMNQGTIRVETSERGSHFFLEIPG